MKRIATALIALTLAWASAGADQWQDVDVEEVVASAPDKSDYPDAGGLYLYIQKTVGVEEDGTTITTRNILTNILTLKGREWYSNQTYTYDSDREELSIEKAVTVRGSGKVVAVEEDGINDVTPPFLEDASIYANVLNKVISFPVAGRGSTLELQLLETRTPEKDRSFSGIEYFAARDPILAKEFTLALPEGVGISYIILPGEIGFSGTQATTESAHRWYVENVPGTVPEDDMPPWREVLPRLIYSSYEDWDEAARFFANEFFPHVETGGEIAAAVGELTPGTRTDKEKTPAIFLHVAEDIRSIDLSLGLGGYEPNDAADVLTNRYGDTRDKAVLLVSMLRAAGIDAWPALVRGNRSTFAESVPALEQFDRVFVAVRRGRGYRFLDPFMDEARYGYLRYGRGNTALVVKEDGTGKLVELDQFDPEENVAVTSLSAAIAHDGAAEVEVECALAGYFDHRARSALMNATPTELEKVFDTTANAVSVGASDLGQEVSDLKDLAEPVSIKQKIDAPDFAVTQGDMMIVRIPGVPYNFAGSGVRPTLAERKLPFEVPCEMKSSYRVDITVPAGYEVARLPEKLSIETEVADLELTCKWADRARTITWEQMVVMKERVVPLDRYAEFKRGFDALASPKSRLVLLQKRG